MLNFSNLECKTVSFGNKNSRISRLVLRILFILSALLSFEARGFWFAVRHCHWRVANQNPSVSNDNNPRVIEHYNITITIANII